MKATEANLLDLMGVAKMQFVIPVYQRVYSWSVKECEVLWDDVMRAGRDGVSHFVGSMLYIPESESSATSISRVLLIDGQQRMTTFSLMIAALADYLEGNPDKAGFLGDLKVSALRKNYLFNDDDYNGLARYKLVLSQDDKETLFSIVSGSPVPDEKSDRIVENHAFFREKMHGKSFDPARLWAGLNRVQVIDTKLTAGVDNAQLIFESMNSKGKPLTPIAKTGADTSVVIVGYDEYNTWLYDPVKKETYPYGMNDSTDLFQKAGNVFITYIETVNY